MRDDPSRTFGSSAAAKRGNKGIPYANFCIQPEADILLFRVKGNRRTVESEARFLFKILHTQHDILTG